MKTHTPETELIILKGCRCTLRSAMRLLDEDGSHASEKTVNAMFRALDAILFRIEDIEMDIAEDRPEEVE